MRLTLANCKDPSSNLAQVMNLSPDDPRFTAMVNRCCENLVKSGELFWGSYGRFNFCLHSDCITWPRQIAAIDSMAVCDRPIQVRGQWFEFLESGAGIQGNCGNHQGGSTGGPWWNRNCAGSLLDRGTTCTFSDIAGINKKVKVYADVTEDADAVILIQGYDQNKNWIRTQVDGVWVDGEYVGISTTPQTSYNIFTSITGIQKPKTNGNVRLYEYNTDTDTQRPIAVYEPTETNPNYRKQFVSGLQKQGCSNCANDGDDNDVTTQVTVMARLEYIPVEVDTDWLLIGSMPALEAEAQSILKLRMNLFQESLAWHERAKVFLREEVRHYIGSGAVNPIRMAPRNVAGAAVGNMI